jgi:hypothetical protein
MCCDYCKTYIPDHKPVHRVAIGWHAAGELALPSGFVDLCTDCAAQLVQGHSPAPIARPEAAVDARLRGSPGGLRISRQQ